MEPLHLLITGAASGIGRAAAEQFAAEGHRVYGIDAAPGGDPLPFPLYTADITDEGALLAIRDRLEGEGILLDGILNIAGIHAMTSLVEGDPLRMKHLVDVNLTGTMLVNRIFHPRLAPNGRILIVTSEVAAFDPMPFNGLYNVTKTALDCYAQALRQELNLIGQTVVTVRPGAVNTPLSGGSMHSTRALAESTRLYRKQAKRFAGLAARFMGTPIQPEVLAGLICRAMTAKHPRLTYQKHRNPGLVLLSLLPKRLQCAIIKFLLGLELPG